MDEKDKKKGFWGSLLRSGSLATRPKVRHCAGDFWRMS